MALFFLSLYNQNTSVNLQNGARTVLSVHLKLPGRCIEPRFRSRILENAQHTHEQWNDGLDIDEG